METLRKSRQGRKARINVESMVSFDGVSQQASVTNPNLDTVVQAISFMVQMNSTLSIAKGAWSYSGANLPTGRQRHVVIQGGRLYLNEQDTAAATNFPANTDPMVFSGDCLISHFAAFTSTLSANEIGEIREQGGLLPASTHAACVAHYPCTQREGNTLFDVVGQYNYAKVTPLVPYHASLINYTAAQHTGDNQIAWKDFYTKTDLRPYVDSNSDGTPDSPLLEKKSLLPPLRKALRFDGVNDYLKVPSNSLSNENGYTILFTFQLPIERNFADNPYPDRFVNTRKENNDQVYFLIRGKPQKRIGIIYTNSSGGNVQTIDSSHISQVNKLTFICLTFGNNQVKIYHNGRLINTQAVSFIPDLSAHYGTNIFYPADAFDFGNVNFRSLECLSTNMGIAKGIATPKQIIEMWNNGLLMQPKKEWRNLDWQLLLNFNQIIDNAGTYELENLGSAGGNAVLSGYTAANIDPADPSYVLTDINSLR